MIILITFIAFCLDYKLGEPKKLPHPIVLIGSFAKAAEKMFYRRFSNQKWNGLIAATMVYSFPISLYLILVSYLDSIHLLLPLALDIFLICLLLAQRSLIQHVEEIHKALHGKDLSEARNKLSMIVSRDTSELTEEEIIKGTLESLSENTVDGITSPLFYAIFFGPVGILLFKTASTLDSMWGYKNERYNHFGFFAAKVDDILNFIPSRVSALMYVIASFFLSGQTYNCIQTIVTDAGKTGSPNAGFPESALAGALGIQLGGRATYFGSTIEKPTLGQKINTMTPASILIALKYTKLVSVLFLISIALIKLTLL